MIPERLTRKLRGAKSRIPPLAVHKLGLPPRWVGYRDWKKETVPEYVARVGPDAASFQQIHPPSIHEAPLPRNIESREQLPDTVGWWGYSFRDVPERTGGETFIATVPECRVVHYVDPSNEQFYPAIQTHDERSLELREIRFRREHAERLRAGEFSVQRLDRATWILERVYRNYSHWFTAHIPKLLLLRDRGMLEDVLMPTDPSMIMEDSLRLIGIDVGQFRTYEPDAMVEAKELTILGTDRFRPELLQSVREAFWTRPPAAPQRRIYISRAKAPRRQLLNEDEIWRILEPEGFERVVMEDLRFAEQVALMRETRILFSIHGAGLTNMMFCAPGTHVVEVADLSFPNPNFYAVASALEHEYWLLSGTPIGDEHPLRRDMYAEPGMVRDLLPRLLAAAEQ